MTHNWLQFHIVVEGVKAVPSSTFWMDYVYTPLSQSPIILKGCCESVKVVDGQTNHEEIVSSKVKSEIVIFYIWTAESVSIGYDPS